MNCWSDDVFDDGQLPFGRDDDPVGIQGAVGDAAVVLLQQDQGRGELADEGRGVGRPARLVEDFGQPLARRPVRDQGEVVVGLETLDGAHLGEGQGGVAVNHRHLVGKALPIQECHTGDRAVLRLSGHRLSSITH